MKLRRSDLTSTLFLLANLDGSYIFSTYSFTLPSCRRVQSSLLKGTYLPP